MTIYDYWHINQLVKSIMILIVFLWLFQWYAMESGWWFGTWMDYDFPFSWEAHNPNWRSPSFFRGVETNHQPGITMNHGLESDLYHPTGMITQQNQGICNLFIWMNDPTFQVSELPSAYD